MVQPPPPMPPRPPPPINNNHPYGNGARNGYGVSYAGTSSVSQAQTSMANMNLHGGGGSQSAMPMPMPMPPSTPMPPPPAPGRPAMSSTPGRAVAAPHFPQHTPLTRPLPPAPPGPRSMSGAGFGVAATTPSRGPMRPPHQPPMPPPINGVRPHPPSSPMHHQYQQQQVQPHPSVPSVGSTPLRQPMAMTMGTPAPMPPAPALRSMPGTPAARPMMPPPTNINGVPNDPRPSPMHRQHQQQQIQPPSQPPNNQFQGQSPYNQNQPLHQNRHPAPPPPSPHHQPMHQHPLPSMPANPSQPHQPFSPQNINSIQQQHQQQHVPPRPPPMPQPNSYTQPPPPPGPPQHPYPQQQQPQQNYPPQHQQQQQQYPQQQQQKYPQNPALQSNDKIDPSQIPRLPLFTRPHHAPATIYPSQSQSSSAQTSSASSTSAIAGIPPPSDGRYVTSAEYENCNPRMMRSTVHKFPLDNATFRKCGDLPLGLVITPLAGLTDMCGSGGTGKNNDDNKVVNDSAGGPSTSQWSGREQGDMYGSSNDEGGPTELDYIPPASDNDATDDPERVPVLRGPRKETENGSKSCTRAVTPPRCDRCQSYLNPFCAPVVQSSSSFLRGAYSPVQYYNCNMCGANGSIGLKEECISNGTFDAATRCGTVEYEVGGAYCVRDGPVENVHLYGVEYVKVPPGPAGQSSGHHHHGSIKSHGWMESLNAIREVGRGLAATAPMKVSMNGMLVKSDVKIGIFAFCEDMLIFPYLKRPGPKRNADGDCSGYEQQENDEDAELAVAIVSDVTEDPFCPLPLHLWTHNVGQGLNSSEWKHFNRILDSFSELMEQLLSESPPPSAALTLNNSLGQDPGARNCGGAALAALADALKESGGRATLITTRRPNYGVGALRDRETGAAGQQSPYKRFADEQRLFTPLQRLVKLPLDPNAKDVESKDGKAGLFYRQLGEQCATSRICMDIVVTSSLVSLPPPASSSTSAQSVGTNSIHRNIREFLDVPTLAELCRATCGKFKWLRVGNECGVVVGDNETGGEGSGSFTVEQLREELKRSALAYQGTDAVFKLRCSHGIQVKSYCPKNPIGTLIGDGIVNSAELELSNLHSGTAIAVLLEHKVGGITDTRGGRKGIDVPMVFFQSAVLYTTMTDARRVRVSTLGLVTTKVPADVFRSADLGTVTTIMTRQAISDLESTHEGSLHGARMKVFQKCVSILANYRMHTTARTSPSGQLILPESLQLLPLFCLSLRKSRLFRNSHVPFKAPFPTADDRAYHIFYGRMVSPNMSLQCVHPNLLQVSEIRTRDGEWIAPSALENNRYADEKVLAASMKPVCQLPKSMNPSISCLDPKGMYILDDRFAFYLFIGKDVPEEKWKELLSVSSPSGAHRVDGQWVNNVPLGKLALCSADSGNKMRNILHQLRMLNSPNPTLAMNARHTYAPLILVFVGRGSVFEEEMDSLLVDDPDDGNHEKSYVDFLCEIHREVRKASSEN